jgi:hypothetical protein
MGQPKRTGNYAEATMTAHKKADALSDTGILNGFKPLNGIRRGAW